MGLFSSVIDELKKPDKPLYRMPRSTQQTIEIVEVYENGIFKLTGNQYSKTYTFEDINYSTLSVKEQEAVFLIFCRLLNSLDVKFKFTLSNEKQDMETIEHNVMYETKFDEFDIYRETNNTLIRNKILEGRQGIKLKLYLTLTIKRRNVEEAKAQFAIIETNIKRSFMELDSRLTPLSGSERLEVLYNYYHMYADESIKFNIASYKQTNGDFKNDLADGKTKYFTDYFTSENKYGRALFVKTFPSSLSDRFLTELAAVPLHSIISIDGIPVPKEETIKLYERKQNSIEGDIIKQQQVRNRNGNYSSDISHKKRREKKEIENAIDEIIDNDASLFFMGVTIIIMAESLAKLNEACDTIKTIGTSNGCKIVTHDLKQREAFNSALPIGIRQTKILRSMLTQSLAALFPFNVQELFDPEGGVFYGVNQVSKNIIVADRKKLPNGNGFIFGTPGSGKSEATKQEMQQVFLSTDDDIIVIDPKNEYFDIAEIFNGTVVNFSSYSDNHLNPLALNLDGLSPEERRKKIDQKCEFVMALCEQCMGGTIAPREKSILSRCAKEAYTETAASGKCNLLTMTDLREKLLTQPEGVAKDIALDLELFTTGALNIFNHQSNISTDNRFTVYGTRDLGKDLSPVASLIMMESIKERVFNNYRLGKATRIYIDELHTMIKYRYTAIYINEFWKEMRALGALCTGITQNVTDILKNDVTLSMLDNTEFVLLMKQSLEDGALLAKTIGISPAELRYVTNSPIGTGVVKFGNTVVPFDATLPKDYLFYQLFNTNMHEKVKMSKQGVV